jgi:hypothetical protein
MHYLPEAGIYSPPDRMSALISYRAPVERALLRICFPSVKLFRHRISENSTAAPAQSLLFRCLSWPWSSRPWDRLRPITGGTVARRVCDS